MKIFYYQFGQTKLVLSVDSVLTASQYFSIKPTLEADGYNISTDMVAIGRGMPLQRVYIRDKKQLIRVINNFFLYHGLLINHLYLQPNFRINFWYAIYC